MFSDNVMRYTNISHLFSGQTNQTNLMESADVYVHIIFMNLRSLDMTTNHFMCMDKIL